MRLFRLQADEPSLGAVDAVALNALKPPPPFCDRAFWLQALRKLGPLVRFSADMRRQSAALKRFLLANLYRHPQVMETTNLARRIVRELFAAYMDAPAQMQPSFATRVVAAPAFAAVAANAAAVRAVRPDMAALMRVQLASAQLIQQASAE